MKKVLIIAPSYLPVPAIKGGAIESLVDEFLKHNSNTANYDITVYSKYSNEITDDIIKTYNSTKFRYINNKGIVNFIHKIICSIDRRMYRKKQTPTKYAMNVIYDLKKRNELSYYDLVIVENQIESLQFYRKNIKSKMVNHLHNNLLNVKTKDAINVIKSCDEFWGVSKFICQQINEISQGVKTKVLYNGVDTKKYDSSNVSIKQKKEILKKIGFAEDDFIIIYVGRVFKQKGVLELVEAFNRVKKENDKLKLLIVGNKVGDSKENNDYYNSIIQKANDSNGSIYAYGYANINELKILYSISSLQIVPSIWDEAFGLIVVEGICNNLNLIVSNSGGIPEIVGDSAIVVDKQNIIYEIAEAIHNIYYNPEKNKVNIIEYQNIRNKFDISNYNNEFDLYIKNITK